MNTPSYLTVELLQRAKAEVLASPLYKRFISGTPLENDIAVWMADFAGQVLHEAKASSPVADSTPLHRLIEQWRDGGHEDTVWDDGYESGLEHCAAELEAALDKLSPRTGAEVTAVWLPIETAPTDGTALLAWCPRDLLMYGDWQIVIFVENHWEDGDGDPCDPSHWMPLPSAPSASAGKEVR